MSGSRGHHLRVMRIVSNRSEVLDSLSVCIHQLNEECSNIKSWSMAHSDLEHLTSGGENGSTELLI